MRRKTIKDMTEPGFYRAVLTLGLPIILQNLITQANALADTVMLGRADAEGTLISASSLANQPFFILTVVCFGLASGAAVLCAQYWGKRDTNAICTVMSMVLKAAVLAALLMTVAVTVFPETVMHLYSDDPVICARGAEYLRIVGIGYGFFAFGNTLLCLIRSVGIVKISVLVNLSSFVINITLNRILIFGIPGIPAMGIRGAAIATLAARLTEFIITVIYVMGIDRRLGFRLRHLRLFHRILAKDIIRTGTPVLLNETMWSVAMSIQASIIGHISCTSGDPVAANAIAGTVQQLTMVLILGLGNTAAVMVGNAIGEGRREVALRRARVFRRISLYVGALVFLLILLLERPILALYDLTPETLALSSVLIRVVATVNFFVSLSTTMIIGILRGGGDTRFCLFCEIGCLWCVALPAALLAAFVFLWPVPVVLALMKIDEPLKALICSIRMRNDRWLRCLTRENLGATRKNG